MQQISSHPALRFRGYALPFFRLKNRRIQEWGKGTLHTRAIVGSRKGWYDAFRLYSKLAQKGEGPHQVFASAQSEKDALNFVARFGPLENQKRGRKFVQPLDRFWTLHEEFLLTAGLISNLADIGRFAEYVFSTETAAPLYSARLAAWHSALVANKREGQMPPRPSLDEMRPEAAKAAEALNRLSPQERAQSAWKSLQQILCQRLAVVRPGVWRDDKGKVRVGWVCGNLIEALYLMLLMDVDRGEGTAVCQRCGNLFTPKRPTQTTCPGLCTKRAAGLRSYHRKGKFTRKKRRTLQAKAAGEGADLAIRG